MRRSMVSLIVGVVFAVVAVVLMYNYIQTSLQGQQVAVQAAPQVELANVVVAAKDLPFGTPMERLSLKTIPWPKASVPTDAFTNIDDIFANTNSPGDRIALIFIQHDEPITKSKISGFGGRPTLSRVVDQKMRAISIAVNDVVGVAGFVLPGDRVDIMLTRKVGDALVNEVFMQGIMILGINQVANQQSDQPIVGRTATVEVTPDQAQKLVLAQSVGTLSFALRSVETAGDIPTRPITEADLGVRRPPPPNAPAVRPNTPPPPPPPPVPTVRVRYADGVVERPVRP
jgi:pilus assembly protein CpaB